MIAAHALRSSQGLSDGSPWGFSKSFPSQAGALLLGSGNPTSPAQRDTKSNLVLQPFRQKQYRPIESMAPSDQVFVLEQQGGAEPAGLHQGVVVHVVLVQGPLRAGRQPEVVGAEPHYDARGACESTSLR